MKLSITADIHNGHRSGNGLWAMKVIREHAKINGIEHIVVLGDLFDNRESLYINTISEVHEFFRVAANEYNQGWIAFPGNHDMFLRGSWDINSLQFLRHYINLIEGVSKFELGGRTFWVVPFVHDEVAYMKVIDEINSKATPEDVLLTHIGVSGAVMNQCFLHKNWSIVTFEGTKFAKVITGHFHNHQDINGKVVYPGSPIAFNFDEGLVEHGFLLYETDDNTYEFIKTRDVAAQLGWEMPPDYVILTDDMDIKSDEVKKLIKGNNVKVALTKEYTQNELAELRESIEENGSHKVAWQKKKEAISSDIQASPDEITTKSMLEAYYDQEKPEGINKELLLKLDEVICKEADEAIALAEAELND